VAAAAPACTPTVQSDMTPLAHQRLDTFLEQLGSKTPTPGGGAVAGTTGATAAALANMVVAYSLGKKNLVEHQPALEQARAALTNFTRLFLRLADEDAAAYALVSELQKLPEADERRKRDLPAAAAAALDVPRAALAAACDLLRLVESLADKSNRFLRSDLAIAGVLAEAAARGAWWNVSVNLPSVPDQSVRSRIEHDGLAMLDDAAQRRARVEAACR